MRPAIGKVRSGLADRSADRIALPSIAQDSNGGTSAAAATAPARILPCASVRLRCDAGPSVTPCDRASDSTGSAFLAFAAIAAQKGMTAKAYPTKGIYYLGGLTEGAETIAAFVLMCILPGFFALIAFAFAAACWITALSRWHMGWARFGTGDKRPVAEKTAGRRNADAAETSSVITTP